MNFSRRGTQKKRGLVDSLRPKVSRRFHITVLKAVMLCIFTVVICGVCALFGVANGVIASAPDITQVDVSPTGYSTTIYDNEGNETIKLVSAGSNREYVSIDRIPQHLQDAFIAIEDERFEEHNGIDPKGIIRALANGIQNVLNGGEFDEGGSTITQQLIKNNVFDEEDWVNQKDFLMKLKRKVQEWYLAVRLEQMTDKQTILEDYLNTINLGSNTLGVQAASKRYFNKDVSELTVSESAVIAAITQRPNGYNPLTHPDKNAERRATVLKYMLEQGKIDKTAYEEAVADDVYARIREADASQDVRETVYSYFVDELTQQVLDALVEEKGYTKTQAQNALYRGGLSIYTTQDMRLQQICDEEMNDPDNYPGSTQVCISYRLTLTHPDGTADNYNEYSIRSHFIEKGAEDFSLVFRSRDEAQARIDEFKADVMKEGDKVAERVDFSIEPQASFVLMDPSTGHVKALVGGRGEKTASLTLNRASDSCRNPGSTFKILSTYTPALDTAGMTLATTYVDEPYEYANGQPVHNAYSGYVGLSSIRRAIMRSINVVAVKCLTDITPQLGYDYLLKFGFTSLVRKDIVQSLALGGLTNGVSNLELTGAYSAIANHGVYIKPIFFTKIVDHNGKVLIDNTPQTAQVMDKATAYLLTSAMRDVVEGDEGTARQVKMDNMPVSGKTGTTSDTWDVWFSGFTPYYCGTIWSGYDINTTLGDASYHKVLWRKIMERVHEGLPEQDFEMPDNVVQKPVCTISGLQPRSGCPTKMEYFQEGKEPTTRCTHH